MLLSIIGRIVMQRFSQLQRVHAGYFMVANKRIGIGDKLRIVPMGYFNKNSLGDITAVTKLLDAKGNLIRKALGITDLRIELLEDRVAFPWFSQVDADSVAAYTHFISALCEMSRNAKRVTATEKPVENEKYAFRCFLLRLGFIGTEYKAERKILLRNLSGSTAFKNKPGGNA